MDKGDIMYPFKKESFFTRNYFFIRFDLSRGKMSESVKGDFIDIYSYPSGLDLSGIKISLNRAEWITAKDLPVITPFSNIRIKNETGVTSGTVIFLVGGEAVFRKVRQIVALAEDRTTIETNIQKLLRSIGDAGDSPSNVEGYTVHYRLEAITNHLFNLRRKSSVEYVYTLLTSTPLDANAEYVSSYDDLRVYYWAYVIATVYSDQSGTLYVQQSPNGSDVDMEHSLSYTGGDKENNYLKVQIMMRYVRIRYVNGSTAQTVFRLGRRWSEA